VEVNMHFVAIKTAMLAAFTAMVVASINWILEPHFITGFLSGWHVSKWFN